MVTTDDLSRFADRNAELQTGGLRGGENTTFGESCGCSNFRINCRLGVFACEADFCCGFLTWPHTGIHILFHAQGATISVPQPLGYCWHRYAAFDASGREKISQIVMGQAGDLNLFRRSIHRPLTFTDPANRFVWVWVSTAVSLHSLQQTHQVGHHRDSSVLPVFGSGFRIPYNG